MQAVKNKHIKQSQIDALRRKEVFKSQCGNLGDINNRHMFNG